MTRPGYRAHNQCAAAALALLLGAVTPAEAEQEPDHAAAGPSAVTDERAELFVALLKRRAEQILQARRPPPPPFLSVSAGLSQGYESNVLLDGSRQGDFFTQETAELTLRPRLTPWVRGELAYELFSAHYTDLRDANIWMNTLRAVAQVQPHDRLRGELGYEYSLVNFPFDTTNSFTDHRANLRLTLAQARWLWHRASWAYQRRTYDTRKARNPSGVTLEEVNREDQRHTVAQELLFVFPKTFARLSGQFYRNLSTDLVQDFFDWDAYQLQAVASRDLTDRLVGVAAVSWERKNYRARNVPDLNIAERDHLYTITATLIRELHEHAEVTYTVTYRSQDSNDPRLDFSGWVNQAGVTVRF